MDSCRSSSLLAALDAAMKPTFTLGIEEEYQTVDPKVGTCGRIFTPRSSRRAG